MSKPPYENSHKHAVIISKVNAVYCNMAQQTPLLTLATPSVGAGLHSVNTKLHSLCAEQPRVGPLISLPCCFLLLLHHPVVPLELTGFQPSHKPNHSDWIYQHKTVSDFHVSFDMNEENVWSTISLL